MTIQAAIITLIGAIISGVLATIITLYVNHKSEIKKSKKELASEIYAYRFYLKKVEGVNKFYESLNKVPIIFQDDKKVIEAYEALHNIAHKYDETTIINDYLVSFLKAISEASGIECKNWNDSKVMNVFGL